MVPPVIQLPNPDTVPEALCLQPLSNGLKCVLIDDRTASPNLLPRTPGIVPASNPTLHSPFIRGEFFTVYHLYSLSEGNSLLFIRGEFFTASHIHCSGRMGRGRHGGSRYEFTHPPPMPSSAT